MGGKPYGKKNRKLHIQWLVMTFLETVNENRQLKICYRPFCPYTRKISSGGKEQVSNWEFCTWEITSIFCFRRVSTHFFILSLSANSFSNFYSGIADSFYFYSLIKFTFLVSKGHCVYMICTLGTKLNHYGNPWTPMNDQNRIPLYIIDAMLSREFTSVGVFFMKTLIAVMIIIHNTF